MLTADEWEIIGLSMKVGGVAVVVMLPIAFTLAWILARVSFRGKIFVDALVHLPLVLPPVVTGWMLLILFGNNGPVGRWLSDWFGITFMFRWTGAALAAAVMAMPLMVRAISLSLDNVDVRLENAAKTLGAGRWHIFRTVTLPLALPGVMAGAVLGFARSLGEFGATITFVSNILGETRTLPIAIYSALQLPDGDAIVMRLSIISVILSLGALLLSEWLVRRSQSGVLTDVI